MTAVVIILIAMAAVAIAMLWWHYSIRAQIKEIDALPELFESSADDKAFVETTERFLGMYKAYAHALRVPVIEITVDGRCALYKFFSYTARNGFDVSLRPITKCELLPFRTIPLEVEDKLSVLAKPKKGEIPDDETNETSADTPRGLIEEWRALRRRRNVLMRMRAGAGDAAWRMLQGKYIMKMLQYCEYEECSVNALVDCIECFDTAKDPLGMNKRTWSEVCRIINPLHCVGLVLIVERVDRKYTDTQYAEFVKEYEKLYPRLKGVYNKPYRTNFHYQR